MKKNRKIIIAVCIIIIALVCSFFAGRFFSKKNDSGDKKAGKNRDGGQEKIIATTEYVELGEYVGVEIDLSVTEQDINDVIEDFMEDKVAYEPKEGTVEEGDFVSIDYVGTIDGEAFDGGTGSDEITVGDGGWVDGFEEGIVGMAVGETKDVTVTFPEGFSGDDTIDGKTVNFAITLNSLQAVVKPVLDDEFVQENSEKSTTVEEFWDEMKEKAYQQNVDYKSDYAWEEVLAHSKVLSYPEDMMKDAADEIIDGYQGMAAMYSCSMDEVMQMMGYKDEADFRESDLNDWCKEVVTEYLIAEAIADLEDITLTDNEYQQALEREYSYYTDTYEDIAAFEEEKGDTVRRDTLLQKVKDWVGDEAVITG